MSDESSPPLTSAEARAAHVDELRVQFMAFKRTLHLIRTSTDLHHRVTPAAVPLLGALHRLGPQRVTNLAGEFCLDTSTVSRQIDALMRTGHVEKVRDPADGRASLVQLTASGTEALTQHLDSIGTAIGGLLDDWSADDLHTLSALLGRLNDDVRARFIHPSVAAQTSAAQLLEEQQ